MPFWQRIATYMYIMLEYIHTCLTALCPGLPRWAGTRKVKPIWILQKQESEWVSEWHWHQLGHMQVCTSLQADNQPAPHHSVFYRPDALPDAQPTVSKHWRQCFVRVYNGLLYTVTIRVIIISQKRFIQKTSGKDKSIHNVNKTFR